MSAAVKELVEAGLSEVRDQLASCRKSLEKEKQVVAQREEAISQLEAAEQDYMQFLKESGGAQS